MRRRTAALLGGGAVAAALALGSLFGGVLTEPRPTGATAQAAPRVDLETALSGFGRGSGTAATVAKLEAELGSGSSDPDRLGSLGLAYQLRWRETGDPTFLPLSERALRRALAARPDDPAVTLGLGNLALIRHDFRAALELGRRARLLAPDASRPYGVVGDALLELGRYDEAFAAFDRMVAVKPTLASYARVAYARELTGDRAGAISAMTLALDAAGGVPEPTAWTHVELAKLELGSGRVDRAARHVGAALTIFPGYVFALEQRARVEAARGKLALLSRRQRGLRRPCRCRSSSRCTATCWSGRAARRRRGGNAPSSGRSTGSSRRTVSASTSSPRCIAPTIGSRRRRRCAWLAARRPIVPRSTATTPSAGRSPAPDAATRRRRWLDRSLRLGTKDALLFFHRGYAAGCAGDREAMRGWYRKALALDPSFSIRWAPVAARALGPNRSLAGSEGAA